MLTGRFRFRQGAFGGHILQVQERTYRESASHAIDHLIHIWRDADDDEAIMVLLALGGCFK